MCGDIDAVAHEIAVGLRHHVAHMNAEAELDAAFRRQSLITLVHTSLHLDRTPHGIHHASELRQHAVACDFHDASAVLEDLGIDQVSSMGLERVPSSFAPMRRL
jgi:hypothetical protein